MTTDLLNKDGSVVSVTAELGPWVRKTTRTGHAWATGDLLVDGRPVPVEIRPNVYAQVGGILREGEPIVVVGVVDQRPDTAVLDVRDAWEVQATRGDWMQTYTGRAFYPMAPRPEDIDPLDIAHALSMICRYGGHSTRFYSVAEHCVLMSHAVAPVHALWALLHDATEAYMGDMIRPLKHAMPAYRQAEDRLMAMICIRFGLRLDCPPAVKEADNRILRDERDALLGAPPLPWSSIEQVPPLGVPIRCWSPTGAKCAYLARLAELAEL